MSETAAESISMHFIETLVLIHRNFYRHLAVPAPFNQFAVLMTLRADGAESLTAVRALLNISKQQMTSITEKLCDAGFITRKTDPSDRRRLLLSLTDSGLIQRETDRRDRRRVLISLTSAGERLIEDQNEIVRQKFIRSLKNLRPEEQDALANAIDLLNRSIEKMATAD